MVRYKIRRLPIEVRRELDARLAADNFGSFEDLSRWLEDQHGQRISAPSLNSYYLNNFDPLLKAVKISTAQAAEIVRLTGDDEDRMSGALLRLVQTAIFDLLVELQRSRQLIARIPAAQQRAARIASTRARKGAQDDEAHEESPASESAAAEPKLNSRVEIAAVAALGKVTATVSKAVIDFQRWRQELREKLNAKIDATTAKVSETARQGGMSAETEEKIRALLMEIKL